jgi:hypothetical protein
MHFTTTDHQIKVLQVMSDYDKPQLPKGGRGLRAPYETKTVRVPIPCLDAIDKVVATFHQNGSTEIDNDFLTYDEAILEAAKILNSKGNQTKSAKQSVEKLLQVIYKHSLPLPLD